MVLAARTRSAPPGRSAGQAGGIALVAMGGVSVQFGGAFAVTLFHRVGAGGAVTLRLVFAAAVLVLATAIAAAVRRSRAGGHGSSRVHHVPADLAVIVGFGAALAAMNLSFYEAIARIPLGPAVSIELLGPLTLAAAGSRRRADIGWVLLALAGVAVLGLGENHSQPVTWPGALLAALAGACWAAYILLSAQTGRRFARADGLAAAMVVAALLVLPVGLVTAGTTMIGTPVLWRGALIALLSSVLPYSLELMALRRITAATFGVLMSLEPALASVAGLIVVGQVLSSWQWLGLVAVVVACAGVTVFGSHAPVRPSAELTRGQAATPAAPTR